MTVVTKRTLKDRPGQSGGIDFPTLNSLYTDFFEMYSHLILVDTP